MRVLDLSQELAGPFAAQLLAELGADVIKVEPPSGDLWRARAAADAEDESFAWANRRKRGVTLDIRTPGGRDLLLRLVAAADVLIESFRPGALRRRGFSFRTLKRANPRLIVVSVTPFGQRGPRRDWQASELTLQAMGGVVHATGWDDSPPLKLAGQQAAFLAGLNAATAALAAVYGLRAGVSGAVHLDIGIQECFAPHWARHIAQYAYSGTGMKRNSRANGRQGFPDSARAADGNLYLLALRAEWEEVAYFLGLEQFITPEWSDPAERTRRWDEIDPHFRAAVARRRKGEWVAAAAERGYTFAPLDGPLEVLASPQLAERGFFGDATLVGGETVQSPRLPFRSGFHPAGENRAPSLGEHTAVVYGEWLGLGAADLAALREAGAI